MMFFIVRIIFVWKRSFEFYRIFGNGAFTFFPIVVYAIFLYFAIRVLPNVIKTAVWTVEVDIMD
jgi:hypothetical protein